MDYKKKEIAQRPSSDRDGEISLLKMFPISALTASNNGYLEDMRKRGFFSWPSTSCANSTMSAHAEAREMPCLSLLGDRTTLRFMK